MTARDLQLEELNAGESLSEMKAAFGIVDVPIDTALRRLHSWALAATAGSNMLRVDDVLYSWDMRPRPLKNGALEGRVYAQRRGGGTRDIGGFKIDAGGAVLKIPAALAGKLPGSADAEASTDEAQESP